MTNKPKPGFSEEISEPPSGEGSGVTMDDFCAYMPQASSFFFMPSRELWPGSNVNARLPPVPVLTKAGKPKFKNGKPVVIKPTTWLIQNRPVEQTTWCPGEPLLIRNRLYTKGGIIEREGVTTFNQYRALRIKLGDPTKAGPWLDHMYRIFSKSDTDHSIYWMAQRVQQPAIKINHALVWIGDPGIGKDSALAPLREAVGPWNYADISPAHLLEPYTDYAKSVVLRINEGRDLGEFDRFKFHDHTKIYIAAPPETLRVNEKHLRQYYIPNCTGVIITSNHKTDGIYLQADDRRHFVVSSERKKEEFSPEYWNELWIYYYGGGFENIAAYLMQLDISSFDPKAPPPQTAAFWEIVNASQPSEDNELADVLDQLGNPDAVTVPMLIAAATGEISDWLMSRNGKRALPHRLDRCRYVAVKNPSAKDGFWKIKGSRQMIYAKASLLPEERLAAAQKLQSGS
jgi:hypothetical protein